MPGKFLSILRSPILWGILWALWMVVIFLFSNMPGSPVWYEPTFSDILERKSAHVIEYAVLTLLSIQFFSLLFFRERLMRILWLALLWTFCYAATDELHQFFTPFRGSKITDIGIDIGGGLLVALPLALFLHFRKR
jgi:VanZ family protein